MSDEPIVPSAPQHEEQVNAMPVQPQTSPARWRGLMLGAVVLVLAVAVGLLLWNNYTRSPQHSLAQMAQAAQKGDWDGVQTYMDTDAVVSNLVDVAMAEYLKQDTSGMGALGAALAQSLKPTLAAQFKDQFRKNVEAQGKNDDKGISGFLFAKGIKKVTKISKTEAIVTVETRDKSGDIQQVKLRMKWADDHWRIVAFDNAADLIQAAQK